MAENIITQVTQDSGSALPLGYDDHDGQIDYNSRINLNIRGKDFNITRDELMSLPESILLSLFPNGVFLDISGQVISNLTEDDIVYVNFDPDCFEYILSTFGKAQQDLLSMSGTISPQITGASRLDSAASVLQTKPAIIVLREDLDYYVIPPVAGCTAEDIKHLKIEVGTQIGSHKLVFSGLGYDLTLSPTVEQKLGPAEQHLFDMLCTSGFERDLLWGSRSMEPDRCVIQSLLLVRLITESPTPPESPLLNPVTSNASTRSRSRSRIASLANSASRAASRSLSRARKNNEANYTKLLLFWRKPARKCWWSNQELAIPTGGLSLEKLGKEVNVKIHVRRVWTLELSVIGVQ
ncbi:CIC11C00000001389 [Sungouiella intermedia]|uniref:CIC11C00000001389 n=1 Tax=Sungouiella intermedia TaxID=45354 RepID=A0A1L0DSX9_9ASCO|nr:CIC11C00000001389 [[Candida] intermedia]